MLIKQLWPVIKTRVKDPSLLLNTVNQFAGKQSEGEDLIIDIELISAKDHTHDSIPKDD